ncbi:sensor histidine kinase [Acidobacteria bacterium AB60]|nr:sensor histidine kinase [Acidobacteria bacterium AB60]
MGYGPLRQIAAEITRRCCQNRAVMTERWRQRIRLTVGVWLGWTAAGLFYIIQDTVPRLYRGGAMPWRYVFVGWMTGMYVCAALTPVVLWLSKRWPVERRLGNAAVHLACSVLFSLAATTLEVPFLLLLGVFPARPPQPSLGAGIRIMLSFGIQGGVIRYWVVIALQAVYRAQKNAKTREREAFELKMQASELARQLATAQLNSLKMQLQPHFLFNTLGAIMVLIQQQRTTQAEAMVERLGDLLRLTLEDVEAQEVPLWRELEFLRLYLAIEQVRFEDRLRVRIAAPADLAEVLVPHMVLQPIVENAVRHGLGQSEEAVTIEVEAARARGALMLMVRDDGPGLAASRPARAGIGLANTRNRLERLYGQEAHLAMEPGMGRGVRVVIRLPLRVASCTGSLAEGA